MYKNLVACASTLALATMMVSAPVTQANPTTPMRVIEESAVQLCGSVDRNPDENGVIDGMNSLAGRGLDEMDGALVLIIAMHHGCPQHEDLMMGLIEPAAAEELCGRPV